MSQPESTVISIVIYTRHDASDSEDDGEQNVCVFKHIKCYAEDKPQQQQIIKTTDFVSDRLGRSILQ